MDHLMERLFTILKKNAPQYPEHLLLIIKMILS
jgi:hypothetical protein